MNVGKLPKWQASGAGKVSEITEDRAESWHSEGQAGCQSPQDHVPHSSPTTTPSTSTAVNSDDEPANGPAGAILLERIGVTGDAVGKQVDPVCLELFSALAPLFSPPPVPGTAPTEPHSGRACSLRNPLYVFMAVTSSSKPTCDPQHTSMADLSKDLPSLPATSPADDASNRPQGLFKRVTTKLRSPTQSWAHPSGVHPIPEDAAPDDPSKHKRKFSFRMPTLPAPQPVARPTVTLENAWTSPEQREAALRACGLLPAQPRPLRDAHGYKLPLSEQEEQLDRDWALLPPDGSRMTADGESEAERIKEAWLKKNAEAGAAPLRPETPPKNSSPPAVPLVRAPMTPPKTPPRSPPRSPSKSAPKSPARIRTQSPPPLPAGAASPHGHERKDSIRPEFARDPNVAKLMQAMQGYKPENYRPPPRRKPTMPNSAQHYESDSDSDANSS